jgi:activator of 2-hydroxyglutaryl-CoA dehydratase
VILLGIDLGSVSVTAAILAVDEARSDGNSVPGPSGSTGESDPSRISLLRGLICERSPFIPDPLEITLPDGRAGIAGVIEYRRTRGRPFEAARDLLERVLGALGDLPLDGVRVTGSGAELLRTTLGLPEENEFRALAAATAALAPATRTLVEIGGESSKILFFEPGGSPGELGIADYATNGDCAAGTGSFLDQQAGRLQYAIEDVG